jgi:hypothetical protein
MGSDVAEAPIDDLSDAEIDLGDARHSDPDGGRHERSPADLRAACRVRELPDVLGERGLGPPDKRICSAGPTVSRLVSKATSWLGQAARPFRGSRRSLGSLSFAA